MKARPFLILMCLLLSLVAALETHAETNKATCAVLTLRALEGITQAQAQMLAERIFAEMGQVGRYTMIERAQVERVLKENEFAVVCGDTDCGIEAGRLLSARYVIVGSVGKFGEIYTINSRLVNVETGAAEMQATTDHEGRLEDLLLMAAKNNSLQLLGLTTDQKTCSGQEQLGAGMGQTEKPLVFDLGEGVRLPMVWVSSGEFLMGSQEGEPSEKPAHNVRITQGFWMGKYEVTQEQWEKVMGRNPAFFRNSGLSAPIERVSWQDCQEFCTRLKDSIVNPSPQIKGLTFRLPTEAEWEYACRASTQTAFYSGNTDSDLALVAWFHFNAHGHTHTVGEKKPNAWGLYDMHGNVQEWCQDTCPPYPFSAEVVSDPTGPATVTATRAVRGGSWFHWPDDCRASCRIVADEGDSSSRIGFRIVAVR